MPSELAYLPLVLLGFVALPTAAIVAMQRESGALWAFAPGPGVDGSGGYRHGSREEWLRRTGRRPRALPPRVIVATSFLSFAMGQMALPGLMAGVFGLLAWGLGLLSIPGVVLAFKQFGPAMALYRRDPRGPSMARGVSRYTIVLNAIVVLITLLILPFIDELAPFLALTTLPYAALSFLHAYLLELSATALERSLEEHPEEEPGWPGSVPSAA